MVSGHAYGKALRTVKTCVGSEWCRFGTQDSTAMGIALEKMTWGSWTPHKTKMAVSGCPRNCAEATIKDFGVIATEAGWDLHVAGNGGIKVRVTDLLCKVTTEEQVLEYAAAFMQVYREEAWYLERTAPWVERVGIDYVRARLADPEDRKALQARFLESQRFAQQDPWADRAAGAESHEYQPLAVVV
jgi:nitrite reductase (NADH) large subunit